MEKQAEKSARQKMKKTVKNILITVLSVIAAAVVIFAAYKIGLHITTPKEYMITTENYFDYQRWNQCSGFAAAYTLRAIGEDAKGLELYRSFTDKNPDGTLAPNYLCENLKEDGYNASLHSGGIIDLKHSVSKGVPVIVLIKVNAEDDYLHYVSVVGYDNEYIYVSDSLEKLVNSENEYYNRKIAVDEFKKLWKNDVFFFDNIYITVSDNN